MQDPSGLDGSDPRIRAVRRIGAILLVSVGLVWVGQGLGFIPGSFMTSDPFWALMGVAAIVIGAIIGWLSFRNDSGPR
jgi:hypothetical protein